MKTLFLIGLLVVPLVQARPIECPKFYPWEDSRLTEVPYQHNGTGIVSKSRLTGAGVFEGELNGRGERVGMRRDVKGGYDVEFGFMPGEQKWVVCSYGKAGEINWWERLDPKATRCVLQVRGTGQLSASVDCT
jgi:hypothetical protein